ncbi:uncharacterized protein LOC142178112 [Nicotiana tabacum]|uniref:Uncharacterized protein LOC142178112 n=1 Tax=Nicotiana tabacum TaxID=4097 RepID=A0AC58U233_TOBAC
MYELVGKLNKIKRTLQELNKDRFSEFERKEDDAMQKLQNLVRQGPIISAIQRTQLEEQFNENELKKALWAIAGDKAPGPDGFDSQFFKDGWEVVGKDVVEVVLESGRSNVQKILICQDLVRLYNRKATTKSYLIKIDLNKAYDSVEWGFVEEMLYAMNIPVKFINWVMNCISTTQYNIALNGDLYGNIQGKHGLRIIKRVASMSGFLYHTKCQGLKLNHLCFADDVLLFCKGTYQSVLMMLRGRQSFSRASGLCTNAGKSNIFSANMDE